ncbi:MAG: IS110 family transposase, partial [Muribaculaceae bacterium]|nr:IS110 family transposase [Muribaculaceae bacterium]
MDNHRVVAGLDVHKDSVYLCIMEESSQIILEKKYGTLIPELRQMRDDMVMYGVSETAMESTGVYWIPV